MESERGCFSTLCGGSTLTEHLGFSWGSRSWALHSREGAHGPGTGALLPPHLWMTWSGDWELLREALTALAAPRGTAEMRREQKSTISPLLFWTSKHHSVFLTLSVLQLAASHRPGDTALSPAFSVALPMGTLPGKRGSKASPLRPGPVKAKSCTHESSPRRLSQVGDGGRG